MKCSACGAENESNLINCSYCGNINQIGEVVTVNLKNFKDNEYCIRFLDEQNNQILKSKETFFQYGDIYYHWYYSIEISNQSNYSLVVSKIINGKSFLWDNKYNKCYLNIIFNDNEQLKYEVKYHDYSDYREILGAQSKKVNFRFPFSYSLLKKFLETKNLRIILDDGLPLASVPNQELTLTEDLKLDLFGFANTVFGTNYKKKEIELKEQEGKKYEYALENDIVDFEEIENHLNLSVTEFKEWVNKKRNEQSSIDSQNQATKNEQKEQKEKLEKWKESEGLRFLINILLSVVLFIFLWVKIDLKTSFIVIVVYNIIFKIWSKTKTSNLEKSVKDLEKKIK